MRTVIVCIPPVLDSTHSCNFHFKLKTDLHVANSSSAGWRVSRGYQAGALPVTHPVPMGGHGLDTTRCVLSVRGEPLLRLFLETTESCEISIQSYLDQFRRRSSRCSLLRALSQLSSTTTIMPKEYKALPSSVPPKVSTICDTRKAVNILALSSTLFNFEFSERQNWVQSPCRVLVIRGRTTEILSATSKGV